MAQANAEKRLAGFDHFLHRFDGVHHRGGIAGAVRDEETVRLPLHDLFEGRLGGEYLAIATTLRQVGQDTFLDAVVHHRDAPAASCLVAHEIRLGGTNDRRKFQPGH